MHLELRFRHQNSLHFHFRITVSWAAMTTDPALVVIFAYDWMVPSRDSNRLEHGYLQRKNAYFLLSRRLMSCSNTRSIGLRRDPLLVSLNIAIKLLNCSLIANPQRLTDVLQHRNIVRNHQNTSLELL